MTSQFVWGVAFGVAAVYAYHHFMKPLPGGKS